MDGYDRCAVEDVYTRFLFEPESGLMRIEQPDDHDIPPIAMGRRLLKRQVDALKTLPSFPDSFRINHEILYNSDNKNFDEIARLIRSVVMARPDLLTQLYDKAGKVTSVHEALVMLGLDIIRGVILSTVALSFQMS